ncbi:MAG TPA: hypothetical protein VFK45_07250 [Gammaproteobacteria bacterium]|nr:hypothetical protein [Gammaproteobacteria bacterium]
MRTRFFPILAVAAALLTLAGCTTTEPAPSADQAQGGTPLLVTDLETNAYGGAGSYLGSFVRIRFLNQSTRVMTEVAFHLAPYTNDQPTQLLSASVENATVAVEGFFLPGEFYDFVTLHPIWNSFQADVNCARVTGLDITFRNGETLEVKHDKVANYLGKTIPVNCLIPPRAEG